jgi:membrane protease YdiL (CAAX protease family)
MKRFLLKQNWWFYFILTFAISWTIWTIGNYLLPEGLFVIALVLGAFGPFLSAVIIIRISKGKTVLRNWFRTIFNFKIPVIWYLLGGIVFPFLLAGIHHLIYILLGGESGMELNMDWLLYFAYLIPTALLSGGNEEPGWRGYITPVLLQKFNIFLAHLIVGIFWASWHLLLYLQGYWSSDQQSFVWLIIYCVPLSMILTWLYYRSRLSVIPVMLMHAGSNVVSRYFPMNTQIFESVEDEFTIIKTIIYGVIAIILLICTKGRLGYKKEEIEF